MSPRGLLSLTLLVLTSAQRTSRAREAVDEGAERGSRGRESIIESVVVESVRGSRETVVEAERGNRGRESVVVEGGRGSRETVVDDASRSRTSRGSRQSAGGACGPNASCDGLYLCSYQSNMCQPINGIVGSGCVAAWPPIDATDPDTLVDTCGGGDTVCVGEFHNAGTCVQKQFAGSQCGSELVAPSYGDDGYSNICFPEFDCVPTDEAGIFSYCVETAEDGQSCNYDNWDSGTKIACIYPAYCTGVDGVCSRRLIRECNSIDLGCLDGEECYFGFCRNQVARDASYCLESSQINFEQQAYCPDDQLCLPRGVVFGCFDDTCYGKCGEGSTCTNGVCKRTYQCPAQPSECCTPLKNVESSTCDPFFSDCVAKLDPKCITTTLDDTSDTSWLESPGWDIQCVEEAEAICYLECYD